ncbi:aminotransferase class III-fold pyridoxal phosphate-dependent enzyme [Arthrobacter sp. NtRootA1]|uniref:aspartate aminotransferase family protein n=1 Tax=Arthrobacter sp. NtRootA1 TaxID=2830983 RepID=UPI001CC528BE|nr:aminotransferase class III-fold pyridoxal phosphate-dependent enzyme [Arthrobacter sp. NtRootA1]BCW05949.1 glutamate-1-semialdehyde 2,1-aminomutase [Arthrobacter sp. NtRootA1]
MSTSHLDALEVQWLETYNQRNARSLEANKTAQQLIAKGQRTRFNSGMPYPIYVASGSGSRFTDLDGNTVLDCNAGWNASFIGRAHPAVTAAVHTAMSSIGAPGGAMHPSPIRDEFAQLLCARIPGAERIVFAPSGSEANTYALRLARAFTGNQIIIRVAGGFHGQHDALLGEQSSKTGLSPTAHDNIVTVPYNDLSAVRDVLQSRHGSVAAVIAEPMMTIPGAIHQRDGYIQGLRDETRKHGVLLILDEVITGCRFAVGGATEYYGLSAAPDLIVMGKMLGGGLPVAVVAGRADIVEQPISASNTHAQNPVALAAAVATMKATTPAVFADAAAKGEKLRQRLREIAERLGFSLAVTGDGPCAGVHFSSEEIVDYASAERADHRLWRLMCLGLANQGLGLTSRTFGPTAAWTDEDLNTAIGGFEVTLSAMAKAHQLDHERATA